jgi:hypothetical protein
MNGTKPVTQTDKEKDVLLDIFYEAIPIPVDEPEWQNMSSWALDQDRKAAWADHYLWNLKALPQNCTGEYDGFPMPKVVVDSLTVTSDNGAEQPQATTTAAPGGSPGQTAVAPIATAVPQIAPTETLPPETSSTMAKPAATVGGEVVNMDSQGIVSSRPATQSSLGIAGYIASALGLSSNVEPVAGSAVITVGGTKYTKTQGGALLIGTATLTAGGSAVTVSGTVVSVGESGVVIGGSHTASWSSLGTAGGAGNTNNTTGPQVATTNGAEGNRAGLHAVITFWVFLVVVYIS